MIEILSNSNNDSITITIKYYYYFVLLLLLSNNNNNNDRNSNIALVLSLLHSSASFHFPLGRISDGNCATHHAISSSSSQSWKGSLKICSCFGWVGVC